jgi:hypothetical protein
VPRKSVDVDVDVMDCDCEDGAAVVKSNTGRGIESQRPCVRGVCGLMSPYWERFG